MIVLTIGIQHMLDYLWITTAAYTWYDIWATLRRIVPVAVAKLEEAQIGALVAYIACYALQSAKQQGLPQDIEVLAQRIK